MPHLDLQNEGSKPGGDLAREAGRRQLPVEYIAGTCLPTLGDHKCVFRALSAVCVQPDGGLL